jgi:Protein of unknown function (DUF2752)
VRIATRPLAPGEIDYELITLSVSLGALALAAVWFVSGLPWPICLFHALTGHPCATCGMTRSAIALFHGDFVSAWKWNPLAFLTYCGVLIFDVYALVTLIVGKRRVRVANVRPAEKNFVRIAVLAAIAINWGYVLTQGQKY